MGEDKSLLPFGGFSTLTEFQYSRLSKIFSCVYISCKDKSKFNFKANFIEDIKSEETFAPTLGFISAFEHLNANSFFAISVDSPFIDENTILNLLNADRSSIDATIAKTHKGIQPLCGIYHRSLKKDFLLMLQEQNHKLGLLLKHSNTKYIFFENEDPFLNLNHPHEYEKALKLIKV